MTDNIHEPGTGFYTIGLPIVIDMEDVTNVEPVNFQGIDSVTPIIKMKLKIDEIAIVCKDLTQRDELLSAFQKDIRKRNFRVITSETKE